MNVRIDTAFGGRQVRGFALGDGPSLAVYSVPSVTPPEKTDWALVTFCAFALAAVGGGFAWGLHAAGTHP